MKNVVLKFLAFLLVFFPLYSKTSAEKIWNSLSEIEKISQIFLVNVEGNEIFHPVEFLEDGTAVVPGGIILFSYNIGNSKNQLKDYIFSINSFYKKNKSPLPFIAVDQEGGEVNRLKKITSHLPSEKKISENYTLKEAKSIYSNQAIQMKELGITMNLAPVAEAEIESNKVFLGTRTFGGVPNSVAYSMICVRAYEENGIASVAKHFPGNANSDPHTGSVEITLSPSEVFKSFIFPFALVLKSNPSCVLVSHAKINSLDENPACMSSFWIKEILQSYLGFKGLVLSDDVFMGALSDSPPEQVAANAIISGVDVIMLSEKKFLSVAKSLLNLAANDKFFANRLCAAEKKVLDFKLEKGIIKIEEN
ncbi:glycoside hydrolase family 3 N-terminal domain-containing protein [uncultured Treponema sp.]|uniref:glycoside hydrolase family 3 N-terminal domain-containing protein n=1 Tax=uncultured Treponema sp. TaxID=162155 RepID=UPI0025E38AB1|nr:glycoside hydrolase family 3 N-terminal domain-containing protein [uncultured Treponema sp.]